MVAAGAYSWTQHRPPESHILHDGERRRMERSWEILSATVQAGKPVYGVSRGFGPLAEFTADNDANQHGLGLIAHLSAGQGEDLDVETTRLMLELRLMGMRRGYSGIEPARWEQLAALLDAGFVPVIPARGSVSASGDLIPLAHAASAMSGEGMAWAQRDGIPTQVPARQRLDELLLAPITWTAREALAFVNGSSASLAAALLNQGRIRQQCWIVASLTGAIVDVLGASAEPYSPVVATARGESPGHRTAARWIRDGIVDVRDATTARRLQEPYSLRCAPQVIGSVLDFLDATGELLDREASGCSDNPVVSDEGVFHAGNFYAVTAGLASDQHATLIHQIAFIAERQLALILNPATNGNRPPLLAPKPGATSGLAGVQLAASGLLAEIRQMSAPATTTPVSTNLDNQDTVPMALTGALRSARQLDYSALILGSLGIGVAQLIHLVGSRSTAPWIASVLAASPALQCDRLLAGEVRRVSEILHQESEFFLRRESGDDRIGVIR